jgi:hypothetical protein
MGKKTTTFSKTGINKLPNDKPILYKIKTESGTRKYISTWPVSFKEATGLFQRQLIRSCRPGRITKKTMKEENGSQSKRGAFIQLGSGMTALSISYAS